MDLPRKRTVLTKAAGWTAITLGVVHTIVAPYDTREQWRQAAREGWWGRFTLRQAKTVPQYQRSEAFWVSTGSFGVPMLALGAHILWSQRKGQRVPGWLGWILLAWGIPTATALPGSPAWAIPAIGGLVVLGDRAWSDQEPPAVVRP